MSQDSVSPTPLVGGEVDPLIGAVLDERYRILRVLGAGGMGKVYEASHVRLPRHFAIKVIHQSRIGDPTTLERFKREAEITSSLGCVHIIDVVDFHTLPQGVPYIVMELLRGEDLAARMARTGGLSRDAVHTVLRQVVSGLSAAHARGVLHRDIKPENIFLAQTADHGELVKVLDFGLSKMMGVNMTPTRSLMGTPYYMSPEQARGDDVDVRTDVYALGVMAYQLLTARLPYEGESAYEVLTRIATQDPVAPSHWKPELAGPIEEALLAALAKAPAERTASVDAFWAQLGPPLLEPGAELASSGFPFALAEVVIAAPGPRESLPGATLSSRRSSPWKIAAGVAGVAGVALLALGLWAMGSHPEQAPPSAVPSGAARPVSAPAPAPPPPPPPISAPVAAPGNPKIAPVPVRVSPATPVHGGTHKTPPRKKSAGSSGDMILEGA